jgi:hypothetical protein
MEPNPGEPGLLDHLGKVPLGDVVGVEGLAGLLAEDESPIPIGIT